MRYGDQPTGISLPTVEDARSSYPPGREILKMPLLGRLPIGCVGSLCPKRWRTSRRSARRKGLYLATIVDAFSRVVVGWAMGDRPVAKVVWTPPP